MNIEWNDVKTFLSDKGASENEINTHRRLFNNFFFQSFLVREFGIITENAIFETNRSTDLAKTSGTLEDLGALDTYDLIDFIEAHELTFLQAASVTPQQLTLLADSTKEKVTGALLAGLDDGQDPIRYSLSAVVQTGFPYKKLKGQQHFERVNGNLTVTMSAPNEIGLPSGIYPRLAFVHICSEIVKRKDRHINLGPSLKKFVTDDMGRPWSTGKKGTAIKWRQAITSLLATSFTSTYKYQDADKKHEGILLNNITIADGDVHLWWDKSYDELKGAEFTVSEAFADALINHATPLDIRAIRDLSELRSPLAFDLYCWLTYRYWRMEESKNPVVRISWKQLYGQLGTGISTTRHFIYEARRALNEVAKVYPQANFHSELDNYLVLIKSSPHITPKRIPSQGSLKLEENESPA